MPKKRMPRARCGKRGGSRGVWCADACFFLNLFEQQYLPSQWLTFRTFWDSIFSRENKVQTFLKGPLAK